MVWMRVHAVIGSHLPRPFRYNTKSLSYRPFSSALRPADAGQKRCRKFFVKTEKVFNALTVAREKCCAIELVHREIECVMCLAQIARHHVGIVKIGKGRTRMSRSLI